MAGREFSLLIPLRPLRIGEWIDRARWPPHVTVVSNFRAEANDIDAFADVLRRTAETLARPVATVASSAEFGPNRDIPVQLVESADLSTLHAQLSDSFSAVARVDTVTPGHHGAGYRPHVTIVEGGVLTEGTDLSLHTLVLVEIAPDGNPSWAVPVAQAEIGQASDPGPVTAEQAASLWKDLRDQRIRSFVIGGWGIDALLGRQTRDHHDLDLLLLAEDLPRFLEYLDAPGRGIRSLWSENRWHRRRPSAFIALVNGVELDIHVVVVTDGVVQIMSEHSIELPSGALTGSGVIAGDRVDCATAAAQVVMHTGYELPEKQVRDLAGLREIMNSFPADQSTAQQ